MPGQATTLPPDGAAATAALMLVKVALPQPVPALLDEPDGDTYSADPAAAADDDAPTRTATTTAHPATRNTTGIDLLRIRIFLPFRMNDLATGYASHADTANGGLQLIIASQKGAPDIPPAGRARDTPAAATSGERTLAPGERRTASMARQGMQETTYALAEIP